MNDRENVITGLECCQHSSKSYCDRCPYLSSTNDCTADLASDAIALLKEQEERINKFELERSWDEYPDRMGKW